MTYDELRQKQDSLIKDIVLHGYWFEKMWLPLIRFARWVTIKRGPFR